jgi:hypothetical protein
MSRNNFRRIDVDPGFIPATPMIGGIITSTVMELVVFPAIFFLWRSRRIEHESLAETRRVQ